MRAVQVCRPYERAGQFPVGTLIRPLRGRLSLPPLAFGHFPLTGGRLTDDRKSRPYGCHPNSAAGAPGWLLSAFGQPPSPKGGGIAGGANPYPLCLAALDISP